MFKGQLDGKAKLLSKFLGDADLSGQIESSKKTITQDFPNLDQAIAFRYFQYVVCNAVANDSTLSTVQKIELLDKLRPNFEKRTEIPLKNATITTGAGWVTGGWNVLLTNPTDRPMSIAQAMLIGINPAKDKPGYGFSLQPSFPVSVSDGNIPGNKSTPAYLALFGPPALCGNWKTLRDLLFKPGSEFIKWDCKIELDLVSTSGERAKISEVFQCSRIPVPPPLC